jgi:galactose mutarotase-like enzyme
MHTIENDFLRVSMQDAGAELISIYNKSSKIEHLWQAEPQWWDWHAPVLFPVVGRCLNDKIQVNGKIYEMEKHGFARKSIFKPIATHPSSITFSLTANENSLRHFPFFFEFRITFQLKDNVLIQTFEVVNSDKKNLYFSLGAHPAFRVPFFSQEDFSDYFVEFEHQEILTRNYINSEGYFDGRTSVVSTNGVIHLQPALFKDDALIFKTHQSRWVALKSKGNRHGVKVSFPSFPYLGIWTKPGAPYVCIEPWFGCADTLHSPTDFTRKEGILHLPTGERFLASIFIETC